jgi:phospholipase/carboxylesterase
MELHEPLWGPRWGPAAGGAPTELVVICHGVGADGADLIRIAPFLGQRLPHAAFAAPDAPFVHDSGSGRQWWSLADRTPTVMDAGVRRAAPYLDRFIDAELTRLGLPADRYALVGFSQGAMMVLFSGLRRQTAPRAILAIAGALLGPQSLAAELRQRPRVMLLHGEADDVVLPQRSRDAEVVLRQVGVSVESVFVPGLVHNIHVTDLARGADFLAAAFATIP